MTNGITTNAPLFSEPYLTIAEFKQAPTAVDVDDLVGGGTQGINDQELANVIARASSWMDSYCGQVLASTVDTESLRASFDRNGFLKVHPRYWPITEVLSLAYGSWPTQLTAVTGTDLDLLWIENQSVVMPIQAFGTSFLGPIQFSGTWNTTQEQFVTIQYVNGYPNTSVAIDALAGALTVEVKDGTGILPNQQMIVYDGANTERITVADDHVPGQGQQFIGLAAPLQYAHSKDIAVSALPPAVKQACIYMTSAILKARGNATLVMGSVSPTTFQTDNKSAMADANAAMDMLKPYRRIR